MKTNNDDNKLKKLFDFLDSRLIIDKFIDLLLIFVGLLCALSVENYIENNENKKQYIKSLTSIHSELENNLLLNEGNDNASKELFNFYSEIGEAMNKQEWEDVGGIKKINDIEIYQYENTKFSTLNQNNFYNKDLLSDIMHIYSMNNNLTNNINELQVTLNRLNKTYFDLRFKYLYANAQDVVNPYSDYNYDFNLFEKIYFTKIANSTLDYKETGKRIMNSIENELNTFGIDIINSSTYTNYYWLCHTAQNLGKFELSNEYVEKGLNKINKEFKHMTEDEKSYFGRLHFHRVGNYKTLYKDSVLNFNDIDSIMFNSIKMWELSNIYHFLCIIYKTDYFFIKNDYENFRLSLNYYFENEYDPYIIASNFPTWRGFLERNECKILIEKNYPEFKFEDLVNVKTVSDF
jgi:hypothetical protein